MVKEGSSSTLVAHFHDLIRRNIMEGGWRPGQRLQPKVLATHYATSTTVIREALTRLAGEQLVETQPQRGFFVVELSLDVLRDLTRVRVHADSLALELAIERGDLAWETSVMSAHHLLSKTPRRHPEHPEHTTEAWSRAHRAFHLTLIEACGVPVLTDLSARLFDATELYRRWAAPTRAASVRHIDDEHANILDATLKRDTSRAVGLLREHYERSLEVALTRGLIETSKAPPDAVRAAPDGAA